MKTFEHDGRVLNVPDRRWAEEACKPRRDTPKTRRLAACEDAKCDAVGCGECLYEYDHLPAFIAWEKAQEAGEEGAG